MGFLDNVKVALRDVVATRGSKQPATTDRSSRDAAPAAAAEPPVESFQTYTVEVGDTLQEISARVGTSVEEMVRLNDIDDPDLIFPGQVFRIPIH